MALTTAFRNFIAQAVTGDGSPTLFSNANARIGVGDSSTAFSAAHTDLQAATNKFRQPMEATYPTVATNVITFRSLFGSGDANFAINEWGIFNHASAGVMMSRKVESLGTKVAGSTWQITATITLTVA